MNETSVLLLQLVQIALGNKESVDIPSDVDWMKLEDFAGSQGVSYIAFDGLQKVLASSSIDKSSVIGLVELMEWAGQTNRAEVAYKLYTSTLFKLIEILTQHHIKVMLLKGYGCSLNYPNPAHRPCGDIDIFTTSYDEVNKVVEELGITVDYDNEHHGVFHYGEFTIENHQTIMDAHSHKSNGYINRLLEQIAFEDFQNGNDNIEVVLPSAKFNSIHLLRHMASDFASVKTSLRHVLDWATFVSKNDVDWNFVHDVTHKANMNRFLDVLNGICVYTFGYSSEMFPIENRDEDLEKRVLEEILTCTDTADIPEKNLSLGGKILYGVKKSIRMWRNRWKYKIVFDESLWESFVWKAKTILAR